MLRKTATRLAVAADDVQVPPVVTMEPPEMSDQPEVVTSMAPIPVLNGGTAVEIKQMSEVIGGKRYRTEGATLLASDARPDGSASRLGRATTLFRTAKGNYFMVLQTTWPREKDALSPLARDEARGIYEALPVRHVEYEQAFPGIEIEDA